MRIALGITAILASLASASSPCRIPLDRPYTLGHPFPHSIEWAHGRMASSEAPLGFTFPSFAGEECLGSPKPFLSWSDTSGHQRLGLLGLVGEEFRSAGGGPWSTEAGGIANGASGPVSFNVDARMFTEVGGRHGRLSFDREDVDEQTEEASGSLDYRSYSRFRGDMTLSLPFGRLTAARDAAHWGPGMFGNPVLSQEAVPFFQYAFSTELGPLKVTSLYGDLAIGNSQSFASENLVSRSLYAHRYELSLGSSWLLGMTEQLILFDLSKPYLFIPAFPLFVAKSYLVEDRTNGNIALDLSWRSPWSTLVYGEFLLDDLESPSSLLTKDYVQNKWASLIGVHWTRRLGVSTAGAVAEFSHVEPWVYGHFAPSTAQAAHAGFPLGNPQGADSRTLILKLYGRMPRGLYLGLKTGLYWKGHGTSASLNEPVPATPLAHKVFLEGETSPDGVVEPEISYTGRYMHLFLMGRIGEDAGMRAGIRVFR